MPDTTTRAQEIRAELDKIAPCPDGDAVTALSLGRYLAKEAQLAWARMMSLSQLVTMADIAILQGNFAAASALIGWAEADVTRGEADEAAVQIREAFDPPGIGEWLYDILGGDAERIADLAGDLAEATAVKPGTAAKVSDADFVHPDGPWAVMTLEDLRAIAKARGPIPDDVYDRLCAAAGMTQ